jgi:hypothetical protein
MPGLPIRVRYEWLRKPWVYFAFLLTCPSISIEQNRTSTDNTIAKENACSMLYISDSDPIDCQTSGLRALWGDNYFRNVQDPACGEHRKRSGRIWDFVFEFKIKWPTCSLNKRKLPQTSSSRVRNQLRARNTVNINLPWGPDYFFSETTGAAHQEMSKESERNYVVEMLPGLH